MSLPDFSAYQPSKTAINRFAEFVNASYGDKGVRAFVYHPGTLHVSSSRATFSPWWVQVE